MAFSVQADEPFSLPKLLKDALQKVDNVLSTINFLHKTIEDISNGYQPKPKDHVWKTFVSEAEAAIAAIKSAPSPTDFDGSPYTFDPIALRGCNSRGRAMPKVSGLVSELEEAIGRGETVARRLGDNIKRAESAQDSLRDLIKIYEELIKSASGVETLREYFTWNWYDMQGSVSHALAEYKSALSDKLKKTQSEINIAKTKYDNFIGNVNDIIGKVCNLDGVWRGSVRNSANGQDIGLVVTLKEQGSFGSMEYSCQIEFATGEKYTASYVNWNVGKLVFERPYGSSPEHFEYELSPGYDSMTGTVTWPGGSGTSTLRLQLS